MGYYQDVVDEFLEEINSHRDQLEELGEPKKKNYDEEVQRCDEYKALVKKEFANNVNELHFSTAQLKIAKSNFISILTSRRIQYEECHAYLEKKNQELSANILKVQTAKHNITQAIDEFKKTGERQQEIEISDEQIQRAREKFDLLKRLLDRAIKTWSRNPDATSHILQQLSIARKREGGNHAIPPTGFDSLALLNLIQIKLVKQSPNDPEKIVLAI